MHRSILCLLQLAGSVVPGPSARSPLCALTLHHGHAGEYSLDALCPPGSSNTDYLDKLVASPALHVCRVYLSLADNDKEKVVVVLLDCAGQPSISHVRAALATEFNNRRFPVLRTTATSPATSWRSELLEFLSETGEKLRDADKLWFASESAMRDFGRHSAVIAQLAIPSAAEKYKLLAVPVQWNDAQCVFADKVARAPHHDAQPRVLAAACRNLT